MVESKNKHRRRKTDDEINAEIRRLRNQDIIKDIVFLILSGLFVLVLYIMFYKFDSGDDTTIRYCKIIDKHIEFSGNDTLYKAEAFGITGQVNKSTYDSLKKGDTLISFKGNDGIIRMVNK